MKKRLLAAFPAALPLVALCVGLAGCVGPKGQDADSLGGHDHDRLVISDWRERREHPLELHKDWRYRGEWWQHMVIVDKDE